MVYTDSEQVQLQPLNLQQVQASFEKLHLQTQQLRLDLKPDFADVVWFLLLLFNLWTSTEHFLKWMDADLGRETIKSMRDRKVINALKIVSVIGLVVITFAKISMKLMNASKLNVECPSILPNVETQGTFSLKLQFTIRASPD